MKRFLLQDECLSWPNSSGCVQHDSMTAHTSAGLTDTLGHETQKQTELIPGPTAYINCEMKHEHS